MQHEVVVVDDESRVEARVLVGIGRRELDRRQRELLEPLRGKLPAEERRAALLETACNVFSQGSYRGTTTAEIAREAGVTEPILSRQVPDEAVVPR